MRRLSLALGMQLAVLSTASCFDGAGTLGGACEMNSDCGDGQACSNKVCSLCGNDRIDPGEVCFGATFDAQIGGVAQAMLPFDADLDGDDDLLAAVNTECRRPFELDMTKFEVYPCWKIVLALEREDGIGFDVGIPADDDAVEGFVAGFVLADFDGDEFIDAAIVPALEPVVVVIFDVSLEEGDAFGFPLPEAGFTPLAADFNLDGYSDLAVALATMPNVGVGLSAGDGTILEVVTTPAPAFSRLVSTADITSDGYPDLLSVSAADGVATRYAGLGDGSFENLGSIEIFEGAAVSYATAGDLNGDEALDLVIVDEPLQAAYVLVGVGAGDFELAAALPTGLAPQYAVIDDLNVDGRPDLVISNTGEDKLTFWLNRGEEFEQVDYDVSLNPRAILRADYNADGISDLVIANDNPSMAVVYSSL